MVDKGVRHGDGLVQESTRIVAQVEDKAFDLLANFLANFLNTRLKARHGLLIEGRDADVADIVFDAVAHRADFDHVSGDHQIKGLFFRAANGDDKVGLHLAAHAVDGFVQG